MGDMVHEVKVLGDQRFTEVNNHIALTEKEERRKREYAEFSEVYAEHCRRMEELLKNTDNSLKMMGAIEDYYHHGCELVEAKNVEEELRGIRLAELRSYLKYYREYSLVAGDLII